MKEKKVANAFTWRINGLSEADQIILREWASNQNNVQSSLTNIVMHMIKRLGSSDVMSFENQAKLHRDDALLQQFELFLQNGQSVIPVMPVNPTTTTQFVNVPVQTASPSEPVQNNNDVTPSEPKQKETNVQKETTPSTEPVFTTTATASEVEKPVSPKEVKGNQGNNSYYDLDVNSF